MALYKCGEDPSTKYIVDDIIGAGNGEYSGASISLNSKVIRMCASKNQWNDSVPPLYFKVNDTTYSASSDNGTYLGRTNGKDNNRHASLCMWFNNKQFKNSIITEAWTSGSSDRGKGIIVVKAK